MGINQIAIITTIGPDPVWGRWKIGENGTVWGIDGDNAGALRRPSCVLFSGLVQ